jgi:hypothetical protein
MFILSSTSNHIFSTDLLSSKEKKREIKKKKSVKKEQSGVLLIIKKLSSVNISPLHKEIKRKKKY